MRSWIGRVRALASVTMIVHDLICWPLSGSCHSSHKPAKGSIVIGLLAGRRWLPLVIARRRDDAAVLRPAPEEMLQLWPVSRRVNRAGNETDPKLIEAIH